MSRDERPRAPRAAERLHRLGTPRPLLRRALERARPDPHRLLADPRVRGDHPVRHGPLDARRPRPHAQRPDGALPRGGPPRPPPRAARARARPRGPGGHLPPALRPRGRRPALPQVRAARPEGRVRVRQLPRDLLRELLLPEELRPARLPLAAARRRHRAPAGRHRAPHRRPHSGPPVAPRRAARDGPRHPRRRLVLLAGAPRARARAPRRVEPDAGAPLDQEAEDDRAPDPRPHLPPPRPALLGDRQAVSRRVSLGPRRRLRSTPARTSSPHPPPPVRPPATSLAQWAPRASRLSATPSARSAETTDPTKPHAGGI